MAEVHLPHAGDRGENPEVHRETTDVNIRAIFGFAGGLLVTGIVIHLLVFVLFRYFTAREGRAVEPQFPLAVAGQTRVPPEPRLQTQPRQDLSDLRAREQQLLTTYGWVDKNAGVVRIPIEQAMKVTLERGLPARQAEKK
jgi:hypothetical protein